MSIQNTEEKSITDQLLNWGKALATPYVNEFLEKKLNVSPYGNTEEFRQSQKETNLLNGSGAVNPSLNDGYYSQDQIGRLFTDPMGTVETVGKKAGLPTGVPLLIAGLLIGLLIWRKRA